MHGRPIFFVLPDTITLIYIMLCYVMLCYSPYLASREGERREEKEAMGGTDEGQEGERRGGRGQKGGREVYNIIKTKSGKEWVR